MPSLPMAGVVEAVDEDALVGGEVVQVAVKVRGVKTTATVKSRKRPEQPCRRGPEAAKMAMCFNCSGRGQYAR